MALSNHYCQMTGWMTCDFTVFQFTVFQSYQDDGRVIMKGCVPGTPFTVEISPRAGLKLGTARSAGQHLTH